MTLAKMIGLPVPRTELICICGEFALLSERFDRVKIGDSVQRLHLEDFSQALAISSREKYQYHEDYSPNFEVCVNMLKDYVSYKFDEAKENFLKAAVYNLIIGNCDAHVKNFSILYLDHLQSRTLAPFYDIISTRAYPRLKREYSMCYGGKMTLEDVDHTALRGLAKSMQADVNDFSELATDVIEKAKAGIDDAIHETCSINGMALECLERIKNHLLEASRKIDEDIEMLGKNQRDNGSLPA